MSRHARWRGHRRPFIAAGTLSWISTKSIDAAGHYVATATEQALQDSDIAAAYDWLTATAKAADSYTDDAARD